MRQLSVPARSSSILPQPSRRAWREALRQGARAVTLSAALLGVSFAHPAVADDKHDRAAERKIGKAITDHYLRMKFGSAEMMLRGVLRSCKGKCSSETIARVWMYIGVVRGSGKDDLASARKAFESAFAADPSVALDDALATPETRTSFDEAHDAVLGKDKDKDKLRPPIGAASRSEPPDPTPDPAPPAPERRSAPASLSCTPEARDVQTRRPIPIECTGDTEVARLSLRYQEAQGAAWKTLEMSRSGEGFRAQIPCQSTMNAGKLNFYIVAVDAAGEPVETLGSKGSPEHFALDPQSDGAPAYPGESPPARCEERVECPPDFPGCEDTSGDSTEDEDKGQTSAHPKQWFGLHFGADFGFMEGSDVCATSNEDFECFVSGSDSPYPAELPSAIAGDVGELGDPYPGTGIRSGTAGGTLRAMLSYDRALSERLSLGGRLGYAFGGGPSSIGGRSFLPVHIEGRAQYWLRSLGAQGLLPYVHLGGGLAQVDLVKPGVTVRDCSEEQSRQAFLDCISASNAYDSANDPALPTKKLEAYRKLGIFFVTAGGGVQVPLTGSLAVQANLNFMLMLPSVGLVIEPSLGVTYGL